jgi:hypothetical protein
MNSQRRLALSSALVCFPLTLALAGCDAVFSPAIPGSGISKEEARPVASFSEIEVANAIELDATIGPAADLLITTDDNILPHVRTEVEGDRLRIYLDGSYSTDLGVKVKVIAPELRALLGSGASTTKLSGVAGDQFELDLSGASRCQLAGDAEVLKVDLSGASQCTIEGRAKEVRIDCSGASQLDATGLTAETVVADLSGASTAHVKATAELIADASGASTLHYAGQPAKLEKNTSGASTIASE